MMTGTALFDHAMAIAATADVTTPTDRLVLFTVSFQLTPVNKERALAFARANPGHVMMDDTAAGQALEALHLFAPEAGLTRAQAYEPWFLASRRLIAGASGNLAAFVDHAHPDSTFVRIELPGLLGNERIHSVNGLGKWA